MSSMLLVGSIYSKHVKVLKGHYHGDCAVSHLIVKTAQIFDLVALSRYRFLSRWIHVDEEPFCAVQVRTGSSFEAQLKK